MSVADQTRKLALATAMSAFPPMATKLRTSREVGFVISVTPWATTVKAAPVRRRLPRSTDIVRPPRCEQMSSGFPQKADIAECGRLFAFVP
jgi:hypothetical protein